MFLRGGINEKKNLREELRKRPDNCLSVFLFLAEMCCDEI